MIKYKKSRTENRKIAEYILFPGTKYGSNIKLNKGNLICREGNLNTRYKTYTAKIQKN